jgi:hypothetical protein
MVFMVGKNLRKKSVPNTTSNALLLVSFDWFDFIEATAARIAQEVMSGGKQPIKGLGPIQNI